MTFLGISNQAWGFIAAGASILFFGTQGIPVKLRRVRRANVDPIVYQSYFNIPIFALSWLLLIYNPLVYTPWGILSAALWLTANVLGIHGTNRIGVALNGGISNGTAMAVSFALGTILFGKQSPAKNLPLSIVSVFILVVGVFVVAICGTEIPRNLLRRSELLRRVVDPPRVITSEDDIKAYHEEAEKAERPVSLQTESPIVSPDTALAADEEAKSHVHPIVTRRKSLIQPEGSEIIADRPPLPSGSERRPSLTPREVEIALTPPSRRASVAIPVTTENSLREKIIGYCCAFASGLANGVSFLPLKYAPKEAQGIIYVLSQSIGIGILTPIFFSMYCLYRRQLPPLKFKIVAPFAFLAGTLWSVGNFSATYTIILLGLAVGMPITQTNMLVAAFFGIVVFKEIRGVLEICMYAIGAAIIIAGAFLLGIFG